MLNLAQIRAKTAAVSDVACSLSDWIPSTLMPGRCGRWGLYAQHCGCRVAASPGEVR